MSKDSTIYIDHILESIDLLEKYIKKVDKKKFLSDTKLQDAVIRRVEIIGEAVKNISKIIREKYPDVSWNKISAMRNILIHEYFSVDLDIAWNTVKIDMPKLKRQLLDVKKKLK